LSPKPERDVPNAPTGLPEDRRLVLPPLRSTLANVHPYQNVHGTRSTEDQRIIRLLNSRYVS